MSQSRQSLADRITQSRMSNGKQKDDPPTAVNGNASRMSNQSARESIPTPSADRELLRALTVSPNEGEAKKTPTPEPDVTINPNAKKASDSKANTPRPSQTSRASNANGTPNAPSPAGRTSQMSTQITPTPTQTPTQTKTPTRTPTQTPTQTQTGSNVTLSESGSRASRNSDYTGTASTQVRLPSPPNGNNPVSSYFLHTIVHNYISGRNCVIEN